MQSRVSKVSVIIGLQHLIIKPKPRHGQKTHIRLYTILTWKEASYKYTDAFDGLTMHRHRSKAPQQRWYWTQRRWLNRSGFVVGTRLRNCL